MISWPRIQFITLVGLLLMTFSCVNEKPESAEEAKKAKTLFELWPSDSSNIHFANHLAPDFDFNILEYNYFYNGSGVAAGDVNNDGLTDLFFGANMSTSRLYLNQGNFKFKDVTEVAGVTTEAWITGVSMIDINQDGWLDIYACAAGFPEPGRRINLLFLNQQDGTFLESAAQMGLADDGYSTQAAWFDYDHDGDLDLYLLTHDHDKTNPNVPRPKRSGEGISSRDRLYQNQGFKNNLPEFKEIGISAGIIHEGYGLGVAVEDFNQDGWPDLFVANDFVFDDLLYLNNQDGTFAESAHRLLKHSSRFSMGVDAADVNNDGWPDLVSLDMLPDDNMRQKQMNIAMNYDRYQLMLDRNYLPQFSRNMMQINNGAIENDLLPFSEIGQLAGIHETDWSWAPLLADFDNDGYKDLLITNGIPRDITDSDFIRYRDGQIYDGKFDYEALKKILLNKLDSLPGVKKSNFIFRNRNNLTFQDLSHQWGLAHPSYSNGAVYADLDKDGDLDLVMNNIDGKAFLFRNQTNHIENNNYLRLNLRGPENNLFGTGTKVLVENDNQLQYFTMNPSRGFQSMVEPIIHIGLGDENLVDKITVTWPDQKIEIITAIAANQELLIDYKNAIQTGVPEYHKSAQPVFSKLNLETNMIIQHQENDFADFKLEPLLPHKFSQNGPGMAVGDVNNDGRDDFWLGGAHLQPGKLYLQQAGGNFKVMTMPDEKFEDLGGLFFDMDNDGDLDLYVVSGGSEFNAHTATYQDRFYRNDGAGNFRRDEAALPAIVSSGSCVTACDFDRDGDLDLFVGGRITPARYPLPPQSYLLVNQEGKKFIDQTRQLCPELGEIGMVTAALWTDFDNDNLVDLMVVGEWMPVTVLKNDGNKLINITSEAGLGESNGWWNSLTGADFDQDGDIDYVTGNLGLNTPLNATPDKPVKIVANDFDQNGSLDAVISRYHRGAQVPLAARDVLIDQMVFMRKRFPTYRSFSTAIMDEVITPAEQQRSYQAAAKTMHSSYIENLGNGNFMIKSLPNEAQVSPVFGMVTGDFDSDGFTDLVAHGNSYATEYVTGQYDALKGLFLKGDGNGNFGNFNYVPLTEHGFLADHDGKALAKLIMGDRNVLLSAANDGPLQAFEIKSKPSQIVDLTCEEVYALIHLKNGDIRKEEFYMGDGYLSQSSRKLIITSEIEKIEIFKQDGDYRTVRSSLSDASN